MSSPFSLLLDVHAEPRAMLSLRQSIAHIVEDVHQNEPDTVSYRVFIDDEAGRICFLDTYATSEAFIEHMSRRVVEEAIAHLMANATIKNFMVFGDLSPACANLVLNLGGTIVPTFAGFDRHVMPDVQKRA